MQGHTLLNARFLDNDRTTILAEWQDDADKTLVRNQYMEAKDNNCLLYTSPSPRDGLLSRMPSSA